MKIVRLPSVLIWMGLDGREISNSLFTNPTGLFFFVKELRLFLRVLAL